MLPHWCSLIGPPDWAGWLRAPPRRGLFLLVYYQSRRLIFTPQHSGLCFLHPINPVFSWSQLVCKPWGVWESYIFILINTFLDEWEPNAVRVIGSASTLITKTRHTASLYPHTESSSSTLIKRGLFPRTISLH